MDNNNTDKPNLTDNPENITPNDVPPMSPSTDNPSVPRDITPESMPVSPESSETTSSEEVSTVIASSGSGDTKRPMGIMIGALLVLIVIFLGLLFFYVFNKPSEPQQPTQQVPVEELQPSPTSAITPTPELTEDLIDGIDIGSPEAELSPIQDDLEELE